MEAAVSNNTGWLTAIPKSTIIAEVDPLNVVNGKNRLGQQIDVLHQQQCDPDIRPILEWKEQNSMPTQAEKSAQSHITKRLLFEWNKLFLDNDGILRRQCGDIKQIVLPKNLRRTVYSELHEKMGHVGADKVLCLARD